MKLRAWVKVVILIAPMYGLLILGEYYPGVAVIVGTIVLAPALLALLFMIVGN